MSFESGLPHNNQELYSRACQLIPGGVNSPVRAFKSVGGVPFFTSRGEGAYLYDEEGNEYVDYIQSYGACILGHGDTRVTAAISSAAKNGTTFGTPTLAEVQLAELIVDRVEGLEMLRLTSSGTEATMSAIRVARGFTGRDKILKFDGCYHGHSDALLVAGGSGVASLSIPDSVGVPMSAISDTVVAPYNQVPELDDSFAAVIVEPIAANMGLVAPEPGFLEALRKRCNENGIVLIFDEVITGFRVGYSGASGLFGIVPDMWCFGKVIGGGLPIGAFGGKREIMQRLAPEGPVYQAGTLSGNPIATAAGITVIKLLEETSYETLKDTAAKLASGLREVFAAGGIPAQVPQVSSLVGLFFGDLPVANYASAKESVGLGLYEKFFHGMLDQGIALAPGPYEAIFPGLSHGQRELDRTLEAATKVVSNLS